MGVFLQRGKGLVVEAILQLDTVPGAHLEEPTGTDIRALACSRSWAERWGPSKISQMRHPTVGPRKCYSMV